MKPTGGNDLLDGGNGDDLLFGGAGSDILYGGGFDEIHGDAGNDVYLFGSSSGVDIIYEEANGGSDWLEVLSDVTTLSFDRSGNDLYLYANAGSSLAVLSGWFIDQGVEYLYFGAYEMSYNLAGLVNQILGQMPAPQAQTFASLDTAFTAEDSTLNTFQYMDINGASMPTIEFTNLSAIDEAYVAAELLKVICC